MAGGVGGGVSPPYPIRSLLFVDATKSKIRVSAIITQHPDSNIAVADVEEKVVRESLQAAAAQSALIKVEKPRIRFDLLQRNLELRKEIFTELGRYFVVFVENAVQVCLGPLVEPSFHDS